METFCFYHYITCGEKVKAEFIDKGRSCCEKCIILFYKKEMKTLRDYNREIWK